MPCLTPQSQANLLHSDLALMAIVLSVSTAKSRGKSERKDSAGKKDFLLLTAKTPYTDSSSCPWVVS